MTFLLYFYLAQPIFLTLKWLLQTNISFHFNPLLLRSRCFNHLFLWIQCYIPKVMKRIRTLVCFTIILTFFIIICKFLEVWSRVLFITDIFTCLNRLGVFIFFNLVYASYLLLNFTIVISNHFIVTLSFFFCNYLDSRLRLF